jgi:hypothetical protein
VAAAVLSLIAVILVVSLEPLGGRSPDTPLIRIAGSEETVFDWSRDRCADDDIPDEPARAFRDFRGRVHLIASHSVTRAMIGRDLDSVRHRCHVIFDSHSDPDPADYDDQEWLTAPYALDGKRVFALVHDEYHGQDHPGECSSDSQTKCWYNAVTLAFSNDGGGKFSHAPPPGQLVASVPYRYAPDEGPYGVFSPSNIVRKREDGYFYALLHVRAYRDQAVGACLIRTRDLSDPRSWRAWGGDSFSIAFTDPYLGSAEGSRSHICRPVASEQIAGMTQSLTYNTYLGQFVLVGTSAFFDRSKQREVWGFYYAFSDDLIRWKGPRLLAEVELISTYRCGDRDPVVYPSLLDPESNSRNFETTGRRPYLYFTRFHTEHCQITLDRDLVRVPVEITKPPR